MLVYQRSSPGGPFQSGAQSLSAACFRGRRAPGRACFLLSLVAYGFGAASDGGRTLRVCTGSGPGRSADSWRSPSERVGHRPDSTRPTRPSPRLAAAIAVHRRSHREASRLHVVEDWLRRRRGPRGLPYRVPRRRPFAVCDARSTTREWRDGRRPPPEMCVGSGSTSRRRRTGGWRCRRTSRSRSRDSTRDARGGVGGLFLTSVPRAQATPCSSRRSGGSNASASTCRPC